MPSRRRECSSLYEAACDRLVALGGISKTIDLSPFAAAGALIFGPWIAERRSAPEPFASQNPEALLPVISQILKSADRLSAVDVFDELYQLARLKRTVIRILESTLVLVVPTAPRPFTIEQMKSDPIDCNNQLGYCSYFANLLDLCAIAVPNGVLKCGVPMGITLLGPAWSDESVAALASRFEMQATEPTIL